MTTMKLIPIPTLNDNYVWLLVDAKGNALVVDPGEAGPVEAALAEEQFVLRAILLTHHHPDHVGGVSALCLDRTVDVYAPHDSRIAHVTHRIEDGDVVDIDLPSSRFAVIGVPGHTRSHVAYFGEDLLFSGDTMFSVGCGRLFEGTPAQMLESLDRLAALPGQTRVCCGHEYTLANCAFAMTFDPGNADLRRRLDEAQASIDAGHATLPSLISVERACNPFLRIDAPGIVQSMIAEVPEATDRVARFAALRRMKDVFRA
jgi:hydroxyacylglutathione hydrolase